MSPIWDRFIQAGPLMIWNGIWNEDRPCRAAVESCIRAYDRWETKVQAWVIFDREGAIRQAEALDREIEQGCPRGPLHGYPIGVKDIVDVAGLPTSAGASHWSQELAELDAPMVAKLRDAGAIILGKTVTTPYAWIDPPPTRNPWKPERTPGGSSSGSAVAVATGMAFGAIGTQTGGSIIRPAAYCGVVGWKPSRATSPSTTGIVPFAKSLDTPGLLASHHLAIWSFQNAMGHSWDASDLSVAPPRLMEQQDFVHPTLGLMRTSPRLVRLRGVFEDRADGEMTVGLDRAVDVWRGEGCHVDEIELPPIFEHIHRAHRIVMSYEAAKVHGERFARMPDDYPPQISLILREGAEHSESAYREAKRVGRKFEAFIPHPFDAFIMPAATGPAPDRDTTGDPVFNSPWTFGGQPVVSFPIGRSWEGLPLAVQFVGTPGHEGHLFAATAWCTALDPEMRWRPPA